MSVQSLPSDWPEMFDLDGPSCEHTYHWDPAVQCYYCIWCEHELEEPPENQGVSVTDGGSDA
ncbi:hypothetical protein G9464_20750 [Halostella sp. JP-L12]|uniref:hypothetical protein n=1 Tax=Halostella TaxID=1843185 RepID=UPI000EF7A590|nr:MULTISPECIES: hypothetical protein [Halostella]NHN50001.1 hypothetical protein [Halostella sp. JP-L12]